MRKLLLIIAIFYLLYYPPFLGVHSLRIMAVISLLYLLFNIKKISTMFYIRKLQNVYIIWIIITIWITAIIVINRASLGVLNPFVYWLVSVIPSSLILSAEIRKREGNLYTLIDLVLNAGMLQAFLAIASFFLPIIKNFFLTRLSTAGILDLEYYGYYVDMRLFGFSNGLTYAMPVLQAFLAMIALYMAINKGLKYLIYIPFLLFSAIVNGRTPLIIVVLCVLILFLQRLKMNPSKMLRIFVLLSSSLFVVVVGIIILEKYAHNTFLWILDGAKQIGGFFVGDNDTGYFSYLLDRTKWTLPQGISLLLGAGIRVLGGDAANHSDIGYINDIWLGGVAYCFVVYVLVYVYISKMKNIYVGDSMQKHLIKYISECLLLCAVFLNFKGYIINLNCMANFFILMAVFTRLSKERNPLLEFI